MPVLPTLASQLQLTSQIDHYDLDDGDATHPIYIDYIAPAAGSFAASGVRKMTLSWKMRGFRSTVNFSASTTGTESVGHNHGHSHTDSHTHNISILGGGGAATLSTNGSAGASISDTTGGPNFTTGQIVGGQSSASTGSDSTAESATHTHTLSGSGAQSVTDGASATITALAIDGIDYTGTLGGPWGGDIVELDLTAVAPTTSGVWHTITLTLSGLGRVVSMMRIYP